MTLKERGLLARTPLQSKKFIASMTWSIAWLILIKLGIDSALDPSVLTAMVYCTGAAQLSYIGGQRLVDSWVKGKLAANGKSSE